MRLYLTFLFGLSGFSALIYETLWTQYLKLFLGHAAYAQGIVLVLFMGGLTLGAYATGKWSTRCKNLLQAYVIVEILLGLMGLAYHDSYTTLTQWAYQSVYPQLTSAVSTQSLKIFLASCLILPQTFLLGATFPLLSGGLVRHYPHQAGSTLATLYFSNSLGGAIGVLFCGFWLIALFGLPGASVTAGFINLGIAALVWPTTKLFPHEGIPPEPLSCETQDNRLFYGLLLCGLMTGFATFAFEIAWIRMLSLILGSSTHAFELMLSAFILGLSLGGYWIRKHIDTLASPMQSLGFLFLAISFCAFASIALYEHLFSLMDFLLQSLALTEPGYILYSISQHFISLLLMLPTTFCAGMALPLLTHILIRRGFGEQSIGKLYASNTFGAILGTLVALFVVMPVLGLKQVVGFGALLELIVGLSILYITIGSFKDAAFASITVMGLAFGCGIFLLTSFEPARLASGVFRSQGLAEDKRVLFHQDGRTASISVFETTDQNHNTKLTLTSNGKPDAQISLSKEPTTFDYMQTLAGIIPLSIKPDIKKAAVIGVGSGISSHTLLLKDSIERVDTIEIEPAVVKAAEFFKPRNDKLFSDPRSHIVIEDARTYLAGSMNPYDLIISFPSNPWVSGNASLYTQEFYKRVSSQLTPSGLYLQWIPTSKLNLALLASIMNAIAQSFSHYELYYANDVDIAVVATNQTSLPHPNASIMLSDDIRQALNHINIINHHDLTIRRLGDKTLLDPLFSGLLNTSNSDYHPFIDLFAEKSRYLNQNAYALNQLKTLNIPIFSRLSPLPNTLNLLNIHPSDDFRSAIYPARAGAIAHYILEGETSHYLTLDAKQEIDYLKQPKALCDTQQARTWMTYLNRTIEATQAYLPQSEMTKIWESIKSNDCLDLLPPDLALAYTTIDAWSRGDYEAAVVSARLYLGDLVKHAEPKSVSDSELATHLGLFMLAQLKLNQPKEAFEAWQIFYPSIQNPPLYLTLLAGLASSAQS